MLGGYAPSLIDLRGPLLRALVARGIDVTACAPHAEPEIVSALAELGVSYHHVPLDRTSLRPDRDLRLLHSLHRLCRELRPELLFGYTIKPVIYGSLAAHLAGVPRVCSMIEGLGFAFIERDGIRQKLVNRIARQLYRRALARNERVFFLNPDDRDLFVELGLLPDAGRSVLLSGPGIDLDRFAPLPPAKAPHFLMLSRLIVAKGVREYAEAARRLRETAPEARCRIAGFIDAGPDAIAQAEVDAWQRSGDVEFLGNLTDVRPALADCAVYVLPSYREGLPRSTLEAMAMGRPVITTDVPGCRETVVDGVNGFLVPPRDPAALAAAMRRFVDEPALVTPMGQAGRRMAEDKYGIETVNRALLEALGF